MSFTFVCVLGCSTVAKGATFYILAQMTRANRTLAVCEHDLQDAVPPGTMATFEEKNVVAWLW